MIIPNKKNLMAIRSASGTVIITDKQNPRKTARPPNDGVLIECIFLLSGLSSKSIDRLTFMIIGKTMKVTTNDDNTASTICIKRTLMQQN